MANPSVSEQKRNNGYVKIKLLPGGFGFSSKRHIPAVLLPSHPPAGGAVGTQDLALIPSFWGGKRTLKVCHIPVEKQLLAWRMVKGQHWFLFPKLSRGCAGTRLHLCWSHLT